MTRAMDTLVLTRARYRRRYGSDMPENTLPSRFLEEVPSRLVEDLGSPAARPQFSTSGDYNNRFSGRAYSTPYPRPGGSGASRQNEDAGDRHYSYEDDSQEAPSNSSSAASNRNSSRASTPSNSIDNIASFFSARGQPKPGQRFSRPKLDIPSPTGNTGLKQGTRVRHPKYGEGTVFRREGDGDDAKITVQFQLHGVKKLVEKFAQLERI